jgi:hypothetical protein
VSIVIEVLFFVTLTLLVLGLLAYAIALGLAAFRSETVFGKPIRAWFNSSPACNLGIPCSALAAFAIVGALFRMYPVDKNDGTLAIKAFSLEFSGPSGPVTLWLVCFLGFVFAIRLLSTGQPSQTSDQPSAAGGTSA